MSDRNLEVGFIDFAQYRQLVKDADKFERALLNLPFIIDVDITGWTSEGYTVDDLLGLMDYSHNQRNLDKLKAALDKFKALGVVDWYPPVGWRRRFWFSFLVRPLENATQSHFLNVTKGHNSSDERSQLPVKTSDIMSQVLKAVEKLDVTKGHNLDEKCDERSPNPVIKGHNFATHDMSYENDLTIKPLNINHHHNHEGADSPDAKKLLQEVGVHKNAWHHCIHIPIEKLAMEIRNAQAGNLLRKLGNLLVDSKGVENLGAYVVARCKDHARFDMNPGTNYLERLSQLEPEVFDSKVEGVFADIAIARLMRKLIDEENPLVKRALAYKAAKEQHADDPVQLGLAYLAIALSPAPVKTKTVEKNVPPEVVEDPAETADKIDDEKPDDAPEVAEKSPEKIWQAARNILSMTNIKQKVEGLEFDHVEGDVWYLRAAHLLQFGGLQIPVVREQIEERLSASMLAGRKVRIEVLAPGA